jgi:hypothetical protein
MSNEITNRSAGAKAESSQTGFFAIRQGGI